MIHQGKGGPAAKESIQERTSRIERGGGREEKRCLGPGVLDRLEKMELKKKGNAGVAYSGNGKGEREDKSCRAP